MSKPTPKAAPSRFRCAIYTRKSTEEGLQQEFNSLDAQREAGEAFIKSQANEGWTCLPDRYDDGGFTGGNLERPAVQRLLADIAAGKVDCVVVYKVDRLSRSLLDFAKMMEVFDRQRVSFVSVTQQFNTTHSMGRLTLNILLSFAQFEREIISERTRDKIAATRRKGKWSGGMPLLGYDVSPDGAKLLVNEDEAARVRAIFALYLEHQALVPVIRELDARGWTGKLWRTRKGHERGGKPFTKSSLHKLLTNITYLGKLRYKREVHQGEHVAVVDHDVWRRVQAMLQRNGRSGGVEARNRHGALLRGLLRCSACGTAMSHAYTAKPGRKLYRYYVCANAQKRGWHTCPTKSVPAGELERFVVERIRCIGRDPALLNATLDQAHAATKARIAELEAERRRLDRELRAWGDEVRGLAADAPTATNGTPAANRLADLQERLRTGEIRATEVREELVRLNRELVDERDVAQALAAFDPVWETLTAREQARILALLVQGIDYDGARGRIAITFHPAGIRTLADELAATETSR